MRSRKIEPGIDRRNDPALRDALMDSCSMELEKINAARSALWRGLDRGRVCREVFRIRGEALKHRREDLRRSFPLCADLFKHDAVYWIYWDIRTDEERAADEAKKAVALAAGEGNKAPASAGADAKEAEGAA